MSAQELHTVRLYGELGRRFGRQHKFKLETRSPAEALSALMHTIPGLRRFLIRSPEQRMDFTVFAGRRNLSKGELHAPVELGTDIRIAPVLRGRKSGIFQIILGAVLVVVGLYAEGLTAGQSTALVAEGVGLIAGGVVQLLTPLPRTSGGTDKPGQQANTSFNGPVNTVAQGNPIPVFYGGPMPVGSVVASAGIRVMESDYTPTAAPANTGFMGGGGGAGFTGKARLA